MLSTVQLPTLNTHVGFIAALLTWSVRACGKPRKLIWFIQYVSQVDREGFSCSKTPWCEQKLLQLTGTQNILKRYEQSLSNPHSHTEWKGRGFTMLLQIKLTSRATCAAELKAMTPKQGFSAISLLTELSAYYHKWPQCGRLPEILLWCPSWHLTQRSVGVKSQQHMHSMVSWQWIIGHLDMKQLWCIRYFALCCAALTRLVQASSSQTGRCVILFGHVQEKLVQGMIQCSFLQTRENLIRNKASLHENYTTATNTMSECFLWMRATM